MTCTVNCEQVKMLKNHEKVLDAVLLIFRFSLMLASRPGTDKRGTVCLSLLVKYCSHCHCNHHRQQHYYTHNFPRISLLNPGDGFYMDIDLQNTPLRDAADHSAQNNLALGLARRGGGLLDESTEPPIRTQFKAQRIFLSLCIQIIARFFVNETMPAHVGDETRDLDSSDGLLLSVNNSCRSDMVSRIHSFRSKGTEALITLAVVQSDSGILLTTADKQFALWTLREVCVAAYEVEISEGNSLMIWCKFCWCLPIISEH